MEVDEPPRALGLAGPAAASSLGSAVLHEHLLQNLAALHQPGSPLALEQVSLASLAELRERPCSCLANLILPAESLSAELALFTRAGGRTVVDTTPRPHRPGGLEALRAAVAATGLGPD